MQDNEKIVRRLPEIKRMTEKIDIQIDHVEFIPGGKTNESYIVFSPTGDKYLARIAGDGTKNFIDREKEIFNIRVANEINISPRLLCTDGSNLLLEYIDGECTTSTEVILKDHNIDKLTTKLRELHESKASFKGTFSFIHDFEVYKNDFLSTGYPIPEEMEKNEHELYQLVKWVDESCKDEFCPVHSDIVLQNFIFTDERAYIIDWEYSTMASRYLDLASFCTQNLLTEEMTQMFLESYFRDANEPFDQGKFLLFKMSISFMWIYWHLNNVAHNKDKEYNEFRWRHHYQNAMKCKFEWEKLTNGRQ